MIKKIRSMLQNVLGGGLLFAGIAVIVWTFTNKAPLENVMFGIVLLGMSAFALFPEGMMKLIIPKLGETTPNFCAHLNRIGVKANIIDLYGPESLRHHQSTVFNDPFSGSPWGAIKINDKKIEFVEVRAGVVPRGGKRSDAMRVQYIYALRANVDNEKDYQASTISSNTDLIWSGGKLADLLNSDEELKKMLKGIGSPSIRVRGIKTDAFVAIFKEDSGVPSGDLTVPTFGIKDLPSINEFEVYDRIAGHVKEVAFART